MARQTFCDRCDVRIAQSNEGKVRQLALIHQEEFGGNGSIDNLGDLCTDCIKALKAWTNPPRRAGSEGGKRS